MGCGVFCGKQPYYQKCFDLPQKRIHSISPYIVAFKRTYIDGGKEFEKTKNLKDKNKIKNIDAKRIEKDLMELIPKKDWSVFSNLLILYGREICPAKKHNCENHPLTKIYPKAANIWPKSR